MKKMIFILAVASIFIMQYIPEKIDLSEFEDTILQAEIKGEVNQPGIYEIERDETYESLIEKADGAKEDADLSSISLMKNVADGEVIIIPKKQNKTKVSLNTAGLEELMTLPGVGESKASKIIEYRSIQSFKSIEDVMNVKGIGEKMFEKMKPFLAL